MKHHGTIDLYLVIKLLLALILTIMGENVWENYHHWQNTHNRIQVISKKTILKSESKDLQKIKTLRGVAKKNGNENY